MDVAIAGGGLIGLSSALELAERGLKVLVVDAQEPGQASWAAAGILGPQSEAHEPSPLVELCTKSYELYPQFVKKLGADCGFRQNGTLHLAFSESEADELQARRKWQTEAGLRIEEREHESARLALFFPDEGQVDNRKLVQALRAACERAKVIFAKRTLHSLKDLQGDVKVLCAGSWSGKLARVDVAPQKGQLLLLDERAPAQVIFGGGGYAVPRNGRTIIGATSEDAGFEAATTAEGRELLLQVAKNLGYEGRVLDQWAGLRPVTPDGLPILDKLKDGAVVATAHYRNGVLLTPMTARVVAALVLG
ncbi:MAG TPA: FAD-dependent oxidoreductase, partial [Myxococcales bacterium]|nr:FAD-dependent oxidoreductase [Myxococcales bacterium]